MSQRQAAVLGVLVVLAVVVLLVARQRHGSDNVAPPKVKSTTVGQAVPDQATGDSRPLPSLPVQPSLPEPVTATQAPPVPTPAVDLALPPTPPDEATSRAALADATRPVAFAYARFLVDRYLRSLPEGRPPLDIPVDALFPVEFRARFGLPPGMRLLAIDGRPMGLPGALDQAMQPQPGAKWRLKLELVGGDGVVVKHELPMTH